jgi:hypothetical protein
MSTHRSARRTALEDLPRSYREVLFDYLASPGEHDREALVDVARRAAELKLDLQQVIRLHHNVLLDLFSRTTVEKETVLLAGELLQEVTTVYGLFCNMPATCQFSYS